MSLISHCRTSSHAKIHRPVLAVVYRVQGSDKDDGVILSDAPVYSKEIVTIAVVVEHTLTGVTQPNPTPLWLH